MKLLEGKKALILGIANERSLAYGIAKSFKEQGARLSLSYLNDALKKRVLPIAEELGADWTVEMDVTNDNHYANLREAVTKNWGKFDILIHSLAYAPKEELEDQFIKTSRQGFLTAMDISAYSLVQLCRDLQENMNEEASVMALTYYGSAKVVKNYNVMGVAKAALESSIRYLANDLGQKKVRVNGISAGPVRTLAASGISGFRGILDEVETRAPLHRNISPTDVGGCATYLASHLSTNVTGQIIYVDSGYSIMG